MAQLKLFKMLSAILAILLLAGAGFYFYKQRQIQPVSIVVDGIGATTVENLADANALLHKVTSQEVGTAFDNNDCKPVRKETVQVVRIPEDREAAIDTDDTALAKLLPLIHTSVMAYVIEVDKHQMVGLPTNANAESTLDDVRSHYEKMPPHDQVIGKPTFREDVQIVRKRVNSTLVKQTPYEAEQVLITAPPAKVYSVQFHDTGWLIALKFHMNFTDFMQSNADRDINKLHPGDIVNVSKTTPPLTVLVDKQSSMDEAIRRGVTGPGAGLRRLTIRTTYINGVAKDVGMPIEMETVRRATPSREIL